MASAETFFRLDGKVAVVTGGGQGIGEAICRRLASAGAKVGVFDRDAGRAEAVARAIGGLFLVGDVTSEDDIRRAIAELEAAFGPPDILINNAGIVGKTAPTWEQSKADLET